jgi:hypothetical protein
MPDTLTIIRQTQKWVSSVVIGQNFCPFAKQEYDLGSIHYAVIETDDPSEQLKHIIGHCAALGRDPGRETSLLIFPTALTDFNGYLDLLDIATALLTDQGYEGVYQLASFHPNYCFEGVGSDDPSHYTNRSPYPMIHILREASLEAALTKYPNPENIPVRNVRRAQSLGLTVMRSLLAACYD